MELKRHRIDYVYFCCMVLIVPLWNWNEVILLKVLVLLCINCTVVELKPRTLAQAPIQRESINCTVVELKLYPWRSCAVMSPSINCTVVELKHREKTMLYLWCNVLIVPLWNWNEILRVKWLIGKNVLIVPLWNWNFRFVLVVRPSSCINCTVVELKLPVRSSCSAILLY